MSMWLLEYYLTHPEVRFSDGVAYWGETGDEVDLIERNIEHAEVVKGKANAIERARKIINSFDREKQDWYVVRCYPIIINEPSAFAANSDYDSIEVEFGSDSKFHYHSIEPYNN